MLGLARASRSALLAGVVSFAPCDVTFAAETPPAERTLAPYFFVDAGDPAIDRFPLASTAVDVAVTGPIAAVTVTQVYENDGSRPIHARYVFPASTRAAVNGLRMALRDQVIDAQIQERKQAQQTFEAAKREGKTAALLEQQRENVFTMSVAHVLPGDRIEVTLRYTELLVPVEGKYELVFPAVVGPRYANAADAAAGASEPVAAPYLHAGTAPPAPLRIRGTLAAALPIREVSSPTHELASRAGDHGTIRFELTDAAAAAGDRDFVLRYRLAGDAIESGLALFDAGEEKFFLLQVEPPARVEPAAIPPRELVFILDVSGSMHGFPLETAKALLRQLVASLRPSDRFNLLTFAGSSQLLAPASLHATPENVSLALDALERENGGGGTELLPALERALSLPSEAGVARTCLVITDGYVAADDRALQFVSEHLGEANVFAFGIGGGVNRHLIEGLARAGQGEPFVVTDAGAAPETAERFARYVATPVLTRVRLRAEGFDAYALTPRTLPDVLASRPVVAMGKWRGEPVGTFVVSGLTGAGRWERRIDVASAAPRPENRALPDLWARSRIGQLSLGATPDGGDDARGEILALGLRYSLLTRFTPFVAVSRVVRNTREPATDVDQPLTMPAGVTDLAVGAEPELGWLAALLAAAIGLRIVTRARATASRPATGA